MNAKNQLCMTSSQVTHSMYSNLHQNEFDVVGGLGSSGSDEIFNRCFMLLKAQRTLLEALRYTIEQHSVDIAAMTPENQLIVEVLNKKLDLLLSSTLCGLFSELTNTLTEIRTAVAKNDREKSVEKWSTRLIGSLLSIKKVTSTLIFWAQANGSDSAEKQKSCETEKVVIGREESMEVCRICGDHIPTLRFEEHVQSCIEAYNSETTLAEADSRLKAIVDKLAADHLNTDWPGMKSETLENVIPLLQVWFVFQRALELDAHTIDGCDGLRRISFVLERGVFSKKKQMGIVRDGVKVIIEKSRRAMVLTNAAAVLSRTRLSGSASAKTLDIGINDFEFVKRVSNGAYARVFLGRQKKTGELYAIKVLPKSEIFQKNQMKRVLTEREILLQTNNPFIVNFYYSIIGKNNLYLVMEFLPGGDLSSVLNSTGALMENEVKLYTYQIVQALQFLREHGIIHHDLKPDNILVGENGMLKLTDFGLSHLGVVDRQQASEIARSSSVVGTPDYIAPEIILNQVHTFTADYWSLGVIIYEMLIGIPPFQDDTEEGTYANIIRGYVDYDEISEEVSPEAIDLLKKLLVSNPEKRMGAKSVQEILDHPWFKGVDPATQPPPFIPVRVSADDIGYFNKDNARPYVHAKDDNDIQEDMDSPPQSYDGTELGLFKAVAVQHLAKQNEQVANRIRRESNASLHMSMDSDSELSSRSSGSFDLSVSALLGCSVPSPLATLQPFDYNMGGSAPSTMLTNEQGMDDLSNSDDDDRMRPFNSYAKWQ